MPSNPMNDTTKLRELLAAERTASRLDDEAQAAWDDVRLSPQAASAAQANAMQARKEFHLAVTAALPGLLDELDDLRGKLEEIEALADGNHNSVWTMREIRAIIERK